MKLSDKEPWMAPDAYGRSLTGFGVNVLVRDMDEAVRFQTGVLGAEVVYADPDFAVLRGFGGEWMLHAVHTYGEHPLSGSLGDDVPRGVGVELRVYGCDPDAAEARARELGYTVLAGAMDKPHGLREACIVDADGYLWVPGVAIPK